MSLLRGLRTLQLRAFTRLFTTSSPHRSPLDMEKVHTGERLARLRELMKQHKVDIYSTRC